MGIEAYKVCSYEESGVGFEALVAAVERLEKLLPDGGSFTQKGVDVRVYTEKIIRLGFVDLVLAPDGEIVGICVHYANDRETFIAHATLLVLQPEVTAKALIFIRRGIRNAKALGMREFRSNVLKSNTQAIRLYERVGFVICGEIGEKFEMCKDLMPSC